MPRLNCCFKRSRLARAEALAEEGPDGASEEAGLAPVHPQGVVLISETAEDAGARKEVGLAQDVGGASKEVGLAQDVGGASEERPFTSRKANELQDTIEDRPIRTSRVSNRSSSLRASEDMNHELGRLEQLDDERQGLHQQLQRLQVSQIMEEADPGSVRMSSSAGSSSAEPRFSQTGGRSRDSIGLSASPTATSPTVTSSPTITSSPSSSRWQPRGSGRMSVAGSGRMSVAASARASFRLADVPEAREQP